MFFLTEMLAIESFLKETLNNDFLCKMAKFWFRLVRVRIGCVMAKLILSERKGKRRFYRGEHGKSVFRAAFSVMLAAALLLSGCGKNDRGGGQEDYVSREQESERSSGQEEADLAKVVFEGTDLEGNGVSSSVFAQVKLTMVNVWATYCNPCLSEMPDLGELAGEYDSEEFQIIGIVGDVLEGGPQEDIDLAKDLISQTGADYVHLPVNESLYFAFMTDLEGVPTTFFVNAQGEIIDIVLGAKEKEVWKEKIDGFLEDM